MLSKMLMLLPSTPLLPVSSKGGGGRIMFNIGLHLIVCDRWLVLGLQVLPQTRVDVLCSLGSSLGVGMARESPGISARAVGLLVDLSDVVAPV